MNITQQFNEIRNHPCEYIGIGLINRNLNHWRAFITGPRGSPYEGGLFILEIVFPNNYPAAPPILTMKTPIYHPNVNSDGGVCIDIIKYRWNQKYTMKYILNALVGVLNDPNPDSPYHSAMANDIKYNKSKFFSDAQAHTRKHAM